MPEHMNWLFVSWKQAVEHFQSRKDPFASLKFMLTKPQSVQHNPTVYQATATNKLGPLIDEYLRPMLGL